MGGKVFTVQVQSLIMQITLSVIPFCVTVLSSFAGNWIGFLMLSMPMTGREPWLQSFQNIRDRTVNLTKLQLCSQFIIWGIREFMENTAFPIPV